MRIGLALQLHGPAVRSFAPQELLLSRTCRRLPDQPVRPAASTSTAGSTCPTGTRVGIERAHIEEDTGKSTHVGGRRPHPRQRLLARSTTTAPACRSSRSSAGPTSAPPSRPGQYVTELRAILARHRRVRRQDGGGLDARRRQRQRAPARASRSAPAARSRTSTRCARSAGPSSTRRAARSTCIEAGETRPPGDPPLGRGRRPHRTRCARKEDADDYRYFPEPDLVPLDPDAEWIDRVDAALPVAARRRAARRWPTAAGVDAAERRRGHRRRARPGQPARSRPSRRAATPAGCSSTSSTTSPSTGAEPLDAAPPRRPRRDGDRRRSSRHAGQGGARRDGRARGGDPAAIAAAKGFEAMDAGELEPARRRGHRRPTRRVGRSSAPARTRRGAAPAFVGAVMKATKGQADGKAVTALLRQRAEAGA